MLQPVDPQAPATGPHSTPQHHIPYISLPTGVQYLVLPERSHLLHRQDRRLLALQLRVSTALRYEGLATPCTTTSTFRS
jgi:hypothetical protein